MGIPEQVARQLAEAEEIRQQLEGAVTATDGTAAPAETQPIAPAPVSTVVETQQPGTPVPQADDQLVHKHRTLQGMYNSMLQRYNDAAAQLEQLRQAVSTMQSTPPAAPASEATVISEKELQEYSPEFFAMMERWLRPQLASFAQQLDQRLVPTMQSLSSTVQHVAQQQAVSVEDQFFDALTRAVPDWEGVNNSTAFVNWLGQTDPLTGLTRQAYLDSARKKLDLERVVNIFTTFKSLASTAEPIAPSKNVVAAQVTVPTRRSAAPSTSNKSDRTYTRADLAKLYEDQRRGVYSGRESDFRARELELVTAINEGRYAS